MSNPGALTPPSFWLADLGEEFVPRPSLEADDRFDIVIVGAGFTGLWTAYALSGLVPDLRVAIVESQIAGYGASGRNGGWCTSHVEGVAAWLEGERREQAIALQRAMFDTIDEVGRVVRAEGIDCGFVKSGALQVAANDAEHARALALFDEMRAPGFTDDDYRWLDARACDERVRIAGARGGVFTPHCATVQPAALARGLARAVERRGVTLFERSPVQRIEPGAVKTDLARLEARVVLRCTEGYTGSLRGAERQIMPLHTMMLVTEPLGDALWDEIGARDRLVFGDARRLVCYAQRTVDGRLAMGAGGRYFFGSATRDDFPPGGRAHELVEEALRTCFPPLRDARIAHRWGGAIGVPRDGKPFVRFDPESGLGEAGGYIGSGVAASNLAGRTLADLVAGVESERTELPWVQHRSPRWEPEPLRWLGATTALRLAAAADRADRDGRSAGIAGAIFRAATPG